MKKPWISKSLFLVAVVALLSACTGEIIPENADQPETAYPLTLTETKQRVVRYDCDNKVISDQIEVVGSPISLVSIHPKYDRWNSNNVLSSDFVNDTTGDRPDIVFQDVNFNISYRSGLYMRVYSGLNRIDYDFKFNDGHTETGSRYLNISFSQVFNNGTLDYHPTPEDCKKP